MKLLAQAHSLPSKVIAASDHFGWQSPRRRQARADALRKQKARDLRPECIAGLRLLACIATADGIFTVEEINVQTSYLEARLAMLNVEHDPLVTAYMLQGAAGLNVPPRTLRSAIKAVAKDGEHFRLLLDCALRLIEADDGLSELARQTLDSLMEEGRVAGWIDPEAGVEQAASEVAEVRLGSDRAAHA
jgi:hypothetical protein